ncbi:MAG: DUF3783 domain-containing protein [Alistipes sp.]|nr:DUF3783 domain-containing protein [Alistipes sp.]
MGLKVFRKKPYIYTVGLKDEKSLLIENLCKSLEIFYIRLMESDRYRTVREITGNIENGVMPLGGDFFVGNKEAERKGEPEVLLFSNLTDKKLDEFLLAYKTMGIEPVGLKAIITPTNESWTLERLTEELMRERAAMLFGKNR